MNLNQRANKIEKAMEENGSLFSEMPDFDKWNETDLNQYIVSWLNGFTVENNIRDVKQAKDLFDQYLTRNLITKDEHKLIIRAVKEYWKYAGQSDTENVFFIPG